ncbi:MULTISPECIES: cell division protein ZapE [Marinobacter]|uniref:Cell division protein ZapE n=1 Tax=Marinobacter xiaoshiensis TaxID=3073652 RepID=A0ABU2HDQ4_9GAMM|nr:MULTISPECIES: cell division protein ZapE [unclassified Marinobacter]MBK1873663.1 AFG1 family ATPase [Marinobacter sp. 1-3A]MBK1885121.1 AFG1 family ATPase [Marinobacter sp. DY40_1A1]MDS1309205.1 cell division protein ZapE [Marinobacter sp. F60267]
MPDNLSPYAAYQKALASGFKNDPAQDRAAVSLQRCYEQLQAGEPNILGVYLWGPVGRGKTWLMDRFYQALTVPARRQHFHHFMRWVHQRLFQLTGQEDPLRLLAQELAEETRVLCFDELFVSDIGDAVLLGGLFQHLFAQGLVLVATSNQPPDDLYKDGFNRERLLPAIEAIKKHVQVLSVDGGEDHRLHPGELQQRYWVNQPQALEAAFMELLGENEPPIKEPVVLGHREIEVVLRSEHLLWCRYDDLCEEKLASQDFIDLCDRFSHVFLSEVPQLAGGTLQAAIARGTEDGVTQVTAGDRKLAALTHQDDGARRFIALVDECYDRGVPLYLDAAVPLEELYSQGALAFPFRRTLSRLTEMQLERFGQ